MIQAQKEVDAYRPFATGHRKSVYERNNAHIELCPDSDLHGGAHFKVTVPVVNDFPYHNHNML
jgi:hypothetical protein